MGAPGPGSAALPRPRSARPRGPSTVARRSGGTVAWARPPSGYVRLVAASSSVQRSGALCRSAPMISSNPSPRVLSTARSRISSSGCRSRDLLADRHLDRPGVLVELGDARGDLHLPRTVGAEDRAVDDEVARPALARGHVELDLLDERLDDPGQQDDGDAGACDCREAREDAGKQAAAIGSSSCRVACGRTIITHFGFALALPPSAL